MDLFIGEIRIFAGNFAPRGWALCNGQVLPIVKNTALFSILGTTYGGDGRTTFALPDLCGKSPMHQGAGAGLSPRALGESGGAASVALSLNQLPAHSHQAMCQVSPYSSPPDTMMSVQAVQAAGGGQPHNNMQPYLGLNFIISLQGVFPPRP